MKRLSRKDEPQCCHVERSAVTQPIGEAGLSNISGHFPVVADNPIGESSYFHDSGKWLIRSPERRVVRSESLEYYDGEE